MKWLLLVPLIAFALWRWRRGYRDEAADRADEARRMARHTKVYIVDASRWVATADPFYDDDGDGSGGTAA